MLYTPLLTAVERNAIWQRVLKPFSLHNQFQGDLAAAIGLRTEKGGNPRRYNLHLLNLLSTTTMIGSCRS